MSLYVRISGSKGYLYNHWFLSGIKILITGVMLNFCKFIFLFSFFFFLFFFSSFYAFPSTFHSLSLCWPWTNDAIVMSCVSLNLQLTYDFHYHCFISMLCIVKTIVCVCDFNWIFNWCVFEWRIGSCVGLFHFSFLLLVLILL